MPFDQTGNPPNWVRAGSPNRTNLFYVGDTITINWTQINGLAPNQYQIRHAYTGEILSSGVIGAGVTSFVPAAPAAGWKPSPYRCLLNNTTLASNIVDGIDYGQAVGDCLFSILRVDTRFLPNPSRATAGVLIAGRWDLYARAILGAMGPNRYYIEHAYAPESTTATAGEGKLSNVKANIRDLEPLSYKHPSYQDAARPRPLFCAFQNETEDVVAPIDNTAYDAGVQNVVAQLYDVGCEWFEFTNEPNTLGWTTQQIVDRQQRFYNNVKAARANAKVMGPCLVTMNAPGIGYMRQLLQLGIGQYLDGISSHCYNTFNGHLPMAQRNAQGWVALLNEFNQGAKPRWQTEHAPFGSYYGAWTPQLHARWTCVELEMYEQMGIPKERNHYWWDKYNGFTGHPSYWGGEDGHNLYPGAILHRTWGEELYGKVWVSKLDFGEHSPRFIGSVYQNQTTGDKVITVLTGGSKNETVKFTISGATSVTISDVWGNTSTINSVNGVLSIPVCELTTYIRVPSPTSVSLVDVSAIPDLARTSRGGVAGTTLIPAGDQGKLSKPIDGSHLNPYEADVDSVTHEAAPLSTTTLPADYFVTFPSAEVGVVVVFSGLGWQHYANFMDFDVQTRNGDGTWTTRATVVADVLTFARRSKEQTVFGKHEVHGDSQRSIFTVPISPAVTTTGVRIYVRNTTKAEFPDQLSFEARWGAAASSAFPKRFVLTGLQVFGPENASAPSPRPIAALI